MGNTINIEALSNIPMTDELEGLIFSNYHIDEFTKKYKEGFIEFRSFLHGRNIATLQITSDGDIMLMEYDSNSRVNEYVPVKNAFQIVRYIDNYLNKIKNV